MWQKRQMPWGLRTGFNYRLINKRIAAELGVFLFSLNKDTVIIRKTKRLLVYWFKILCSFYSTHTSWLFFPLETFSSYFSLCSLFFFQKSYSCTPKISLFIQIFPQRKILLSITINCIIFTWIWDKIYFPLSVPLSMWHFGLVWPHPPWGQARPGCPVSHFHINFWIILGLGTKTPSSSHEGAN